MISGPKKTISIIVPLDLYEELDALAKGASHSLSAYLRQVLKAHLHYIQRVSPHPPGANRGNHPGVVPHTGGSTNGEPTSPAPRADHSPAPQNRRCP